MFSRHCCQKRPLFSFHSWYSHMLVTFRSSICQNSRLWLSAGCDASTILYHDGKSRSGLPCYSRERLRCCRHLFVTSSVLKQTLTRYKLLRYLDQIIHVLWHAYHSIDSSKRIQQALIDPVMSLFVKRVENIFVLRRILKSQKGKNKGKQMRIATLTDSLGYYSLSKGLSSWYVYGWRQALDRPLFDL